MNPAAVDLVDGVSGVIPGHWCHYVVVDLSHLFAMLAHLCNKSSYIGLQRDACDVGEFIHFIGETKETLQEEI